MILFLKNIYPCITREIFIIFNVDLSEFEPLTRCQLGALSKLFADPPVMNDCFREILTLVFRGVLTLVLMGGGLMCPPRKCFYFFTKNLSP